MGVELDGDGVLREQLDQLAEDVEPDTPGGWLVGTGVNYAVYVNFGTRYQNPQPFFTSTIVEARADLESFVRRHTNTSLEAQDDADAVVRVVALALERRMKEKAPVDTGTLRASIRAVKGGSPGDLPPAEDVDPDAETEVEIPA